MLIILVKFQVPASSASSQMTYPSSRHLSIFRTQGEISILVITLAQGNLWYSQLTSTNPACIATTSPYPGYSMHVSEMLHLASAKNLDLPSFSLTVAKFYPDLFQPMSRNLYTQGHMQIIWKYATQIDIQFRMKLHSSYQTVMRLRLGGKVERYLLVEKRTRGSIFNSQNYFCFPSNYVLKPTVISL